MNQLQITGRLKIYAGRLNEFKYLAAQCFTSAKEKNQNTLKYEWFFNEDQTE